MCLVADFYSPKRSLGYHCLIHLFVFKFPKNHSSCLHRQLAPQYIILSDWLLPCSKFFLTMSFKKINYFVGLKRWLFQHLCQQVFIYFIIATISNSSSLGSIALFLHSQTPVCDWRIHTHSGTHAHQIKQVSFKFSTFLVAWLQPSVTMCSFYCGPGRLT